MSDPSIAPGQRWGLYVHDGMVYERITIERLSDDGKIAHGVNGDGQPRFVGVRRLETRGELLTDREDS